MLLDPKAGVLVQGITGREASRMVEDSLAYGSNIVAGVTPGKGGQHVHGIPVYDTVAAAVESIMRQSASFLFLRPLCLMLRWNPSMRVCSSV